MSVLLVGFLAPMPNISLAQTSVTNSTDSNFLTYEDTTRGFKMQYPSDWKKIDYPFPLPVAFMSPAQNATDKLFENLIVATIPIPNQNITLDQASLGFIEELRSSFQEFDIVIPPQETMLGGIPAYNMTYTGIRAPEHDPSLILKLTLMVTWTVNDSKLNAVTYAGTESQFNYSLNKAQEMIESFEFLPLRQISTSAGPQTEINNGSTLWP